MGNKGTEKMGGGGRTLTQDTHARAPFEECQEFVYQTCPVRDEKGGGRTDDKLCGDENEQIAHRVCKISCC